ncbi:alpha/beta fold hydrolase [Neotabrizicola sp. VNH66]|uniref:alpha/beta fold hydrolase n=1 Tax=Neotabrizicola sp. VNH66 TaxID=3400918 RepID=UPI003C0E324D
MTAEAAPFRADLADGPEGGHAVWLRASDGVRIRLGLWPGGAKGTVVLLPGRTEYVEKYGRAAAALRQRGWSVLTIDWRGQGLADRILPDPMLGHVGAFADYQLDLDAALLWLRQEGGAAGFCGPLMMMAHSMGGLIGLRALYRDLGFRAAVFSAPMWGIHMPIWRRPSAAVLSRLRLRLPQDHGYAPTTSGKSYLLVAPFEGNLLTGDPEMWAYMHRHALAESGFGLGGPSLGWVRDALREARALLRMAAPDVPAIVGLGGHEGIVEPGPIRRRMAAWPGAELDFYPEARHELPMERAAIRDRFFDRAAELYERTAPAQAVAAR